MVENNDVWRQSNREKSRSISGAAPKNYQQNRQALRDPLKRPFLPSFPRDHLLPNDKFARRYHTYSLFLAIFRVLSGISELDPNSTWRQKISNSYNIAMMAKHQKKNLSASHQIIKQLQQNNTPKMQQANQNSPLESWFAWLGCETCNWFSAGKMTEDVPFSYPFASLAKPLWLSDSAWL
jgi:uncharacterized protein involved in tolerance to divalent cations